MNICVLSGGGSKGAFQVGALNTLIQQGTRFDAFFGVSTGALSAAYMACVPKEDQHLRIDELASLYLSLKSERSIFSFKPTLLGKAVDFIFGRGIYNPAPLKRLIDEDVLLERLTKSGVHFGCEAVHMSSGRTVRVDNTVYTPASTLKYGILASGMQPGLMVPVQDYVDGGVRNITPLAQAFDWAKKYSDHSSVIQMFVILCQPMQMQFSDMGDARGYELALRAIDVLTNEIWLGDIKEAISRNQHWNKAHADDVQVEFRFILPDIDMGSSLDFSKATVTRRMLLGSARATEYLTQAEMLEELYHD